MTVGTAPARDARRWPFGTTPVLIVAALLAAACAQAGLPTPQRLPDGDHADDEAATVAAQFGPMRHTRPAWAPDGSLIAFEASLRADGFNKEIYIMNADGTNPRNCTRHAARDFRPAWSRDGTAIAFYSDRSGNDDVYQIAVRDGACTGDAIRLTAGASLDVTGTSQSWGPGGQLAFTTKRDGNLEVYLMDAGGQNPRNCTDHPSSDHDAAWSPGGGAIAFHSHRGLSPSRGNGEIWIAPVANGRCGAAERITTDGIRQDESPNWNPGGGRLVFHRNIPRADGSANFEIMKIDLSTRKKRRLTDNPANDMYPAWSPDGSTIAFASNRAGVYDIWVMSANGSNPLNLTGSHTAAP